MKKILKIVGTSLLAITMSLTLTGCGKSTTTSSSNKLVIWGFEDEDVFSPILKDFVANNKNIEVSYQKKTLDSNYETDALNSILSGQGPDVWAIPNDWVYRHKDKLAPMPSNLLTDDKIVAKDYFADVVIEDNAFDNNLYGLTPSIDILRIYYNPEIFDRAKQVVNQTFGESDPEKQNELNQILNKFPITWSEFNKVIPYLTTKNGSTITIGGAAIGTSGNVSQSADLLSLLMLQNGTKMVSDDLTQSTINLPVKNSSNTDVYAGKNAVDFYNSFSNPNSPTYTWSSSMPNDVEAFTKNQVTMIFGYSNTASYLKQVYPNFQFEQALIPQIGDTNDIIDYTHYTSYVVPEASPMTKTAWEFIKLLSVDDASTYVSATDEVSSKKVEAEIVLKNRGASTPSQDQIKTSKSWNKGRYPINVDLQLKSAIDRVNSGSQNSQAALDTASSNITELLRKTTW